MEVMELSQKLDTLDILKSGNSIRGLVDKTHNMNNWSPRITRSKSENKKQVLLPNATTTTTTKILKVQQDPQKEIEKIYLNKEVKIVHKNLETIYEDPVLKKGNTLFLGLTKVKRSLHLSREFRITSKQKSKSRKIKIKRLGKKPKMPKLTDSEFQQKMLSIGRYIHGESISNKADSEKIESTEELPFRD